ncbi:MAG: type II secretion system F family protein [Deltaproteobacteria bacterium]|nr:type II secretion system F family protein [Deltaproteobacteria bacterium]
MTSWPFIVWVLALSAVVSLSLLAASIRFLFHDSRKALALDRRLQTVRRQALSAYGESETRPENNPADSESVLSLAAAGAFRVAAMVVPVDASERAKIGVLITKAGFKHRDALAVFLSLKMVLMLAGGAAAGILAWWTALLGGHPAVVGASGLAGAVLGGLLPEAALRRLMARRRLRLSRALPDAFDLMVLCLGAGYTFERALALVARELRPIAPDLAGELGSVEAELRVGADRKGVLLNLYERTEAEGIRDFATTVIQAERYGTPIGQSIQNIAAAERTQRAARIEAQAGRLPVIMSLPMLVLVVPGILLLLGGPAFMRAMEAMKGLGGSP